MKLIKFQKSDYFVLISLLVFLVYKFANLTFRFSDANAYVYMAQSLVHGIWPYRDFFLADPPVFLLFLALFKSIAGSNWLILQALPAILEAASVLVMYFLLRPKIRLAWLVAPVYLFSFTVLGTSNFNTGVQLTVLLSLLALLFWEKKFPMLSGVVWALAVLTKLYALPAFLGFFGFIVWKKYGWGKLITAFFVTGLVVLLPFFWASPHGFFQSIIIHQLHRTAGNNKLDIWLYFLKTEWILVLMGILGATIKTSRAYLWPFVLSVVFFLLFRDLYYLYLDYFFCYLVIFSLILFEKLWDDLEIRPLAMIASLLLFWSVLSGWLHYRNSAEAHSDFNNAQEIGSYLAGQTAHAEIYGSHEIVPLLSLFSGKQIFGNYIDTNTQVFAARTLDLEQVSVAAVNRGIYLIARITDLPDYNIKDLGYEGFFSKEVFAKSCSRLKFFPGTSLEQGNYIGIYDCHN